MAEEWDFQARPLVKTYQRQRRDLDVQQVHQARRMLANGRTLVQIAGALKCSASDVDRALWTWIGVRIRRGADGTLTVE